MAGMGANTKQFSISLCVLFAPTTVQTLVVPMSRPTIICLLLIRFPSHSQRHPQYSAPCANVKSEGYTEMLEFIGEFDNNFFHIYQIYDRGDFVLFGHIANNFL